jgi:copper homeostasis protein (lipoprotein)
MLLRSCVGVSALVVLGACSSPAENGRADAAPRDSVGASASLVGLSAVRSWAGDLPCADCAAIETAITLAPDGTYRRQGVYRGTKGGGDTILTDIGRWTHNQGGTRVTLRGSVQAPGHFAVDPDGALRLLDLEGQDIVSPLNYRLTAVASPIEITHPSRLVAAFRYLADAASVVECGSGLPFPVDMSADYPTLEARYLTSSVRPGEPLVVRLRAHLAARPAMEGNDTVPSIIVDSVTAINRDDGCAALRTHDAIASNRWRLVELSGADGPLPLPAENRATFEWDRSEGRFAGHSGCNRYSAMGVLRGTTLAAGPIIGTKMACLAPEANAVETRLLVLLSAFPALRVDGDTLVFSEGPADVARFVRAFEPAGTSPD